MERVLAKGGFYVYVASRVADCLFDVIARKDQELILLMVRPFVDSLRNEMVTEFKSLARAINATPLIVAEKSVQAPLEDGVLYTRFDVPVLTLNTLEDFMIEGVPPFMFAARGGLYVKMDGEELRRIREQKGLTLGMLARATGVSRKAIQQYEKGMGTFIDIALKVEEFLGEPIIVPLNPFAIVQQTEAGAVVKARGRFADGDRDIIYTLGKLGFETIPAVRCPFDALGKMKESTLLAGIERQDPAMQMKREISLAHVSKVAEARGVVFTRLVAKKRSSGLATISLSELKKTTEAERLLEIIDERGSKMKGRR
jgi:putative transcriptional regulator